MSENINKYIVYALIFLNIYTAASLYEIKKEFKENAIIVNSKIENLAIDTNGKLAENKKAIESLADNQTSQVVTKEVDYVKKENSNDADVELKNNPAHIVVKVNNGEKYSFDLLPDEKYKFEKGKLQINQAYITSISIKQKEIERSRYSLITATNADKEFLGGLNYELGNTVSATFIVGQGIKPYYGLTWKIGSHK